ncbi:sugar phosphate nucleotidyltransferase [Candidatus Thiodictyon syntrophicum]|jgi:dTDP-glucose pyrophosphorylase|uniref:sugar phosphate nucleotidyltransferase n=1 Tax=Candidatus Thiodictyon syntrophicum TaxID=1166950 RepID=UPI0012FE63E7
MSTIAILLSGGQGSRLGKIGRQLPKPLTRVGDVPIINTIVDKLLALRSRRAWKRSTKMT